MTEPYIDELYSSLTAKQFLKQTYSTTVWEPEIEIDYSEKRIHMIERINYYSKETDKFVGTIPTGRDGSMMLYVQGRIIW